MTILREIADDVASGRPRGIPSWCTAHPQTLAAILRHYRDDDAPILIEATCNQVNQDGGYTGLTPAGFRAFVEGIARAEGVAPARLILGGDHLGPNPWRREPAAVAMDKARAMVAAYVAAGFEKIHLDASMACADDRNLTEAEMAARAADLAAVAEAGGAAPVYVVGTEVPVPGGETAPVDALAVTRPEAVRATLEAHRHAFAARGLGGAFERVLAVVVQPGVDFGNAQVVAFDPAAAAGLAATRPDLGGPVFEAHSTDYQTEAALAGLVAAGFAVLKVGPELTFAFRQAAFAMSWLAREMGLGPGIEPALRDAMQAAPEDWRPYVASGAGEEIEMLYGLSDRVRYYWPKPGPTAALADLFAALRRADVPPGLLAQATGSLVAPVARDALPEAVIDRMVGAVVAKYRRAAGA